MALLLFLCDERLVRMRKVRERNCTMRLPSRPAPFATSEARLSLTSVPCLPRALLRWSHALAMQSLSCYCGRSVAASATWTSRKTSSARLSSQASVRSSFRKATDLGQQALKT